MHFQTVLRMSAGAALLGLLIVASEGFSQRGRPGGGGGGGPVAGHRAPSAPRDVGQGPAMSRPAGRPNAGVAQAGVGKDRPNIGNAQPGAGKDRPNIGNAQVGAGKDRPNIGNAQIGAGNDRPNLAGGPGGASKVGSNFQRPNAGTGPAPKLGDGNRGPANVAKGPAAPGRTGGGASSAQLNDFLGGGRGGAPGAGNNVAKGGLPGIGSGDRPNVTRPGLGKGDRPGDGKGDRPILGKGDRPEDGNGDRPILGKGDRPNVGDALRPDVNINGNVNIGNKNKTVNYAQNKQTWVDNRHATGNQVRVNAGNRYATAYTSNSYRHGVVGGYPYYGGWAVRGPYYGWRTTSYAALGTFVGATWAAAAAQPVYYAYGTGGNVYYENNTVYINGQPSGTPEQYAQQAITQATAAPTQVEETEWLPLGAFAFTREDVSDSQGMIELAINKQGVLGGTYYNETTGISRPLKGTLDQKSQRVAIGFADGKNADLALETGVYNLTQDEAPGLLHMGTKDSTPVLLVRLQPPAEQPKGP